MGMFDSLFPRKRSENLDFSNEWQTKAFDCVLNGYFIGDKMPTPLGVQTYQVEVLGGPDTDFMWATVESGILTEVGVDRDENLPALWYMGN